MVWFFLFSVPQRGTIWERRSVRFRRPTGPSALAAVGWVFLLASPTRTHSANWRERQGSAPYGRALPQRTQPRWSRLHLSWAKVVDLNYCQYSYYNFFVRQRNNRELFLLLSINVWLQGRNTCFLIPLFQLKSRGRTIWHYKEWEVKCSQALSACAKNHLYPKLRKTTLVVFSRRFTSSGNWAVLIH